MIDPIFDRRHKKDATGRDRAKRKKRSRRKSRRRNREMKFDKFFRDERQM